MSASRSPQSSSSEPTHYQQLGISPWASTESIRRAYRELSKRYHPDTSMLPPELAKQRFQRLQQAYAVLSNPAQRATYDASIGCGKVPVLHLQRQTAATDEHVTADSEFASYDLATRPLSAAEISALVAFGGAVVLSLCVIGVMAWVSL